MNPTNKDEMHIVRGFKTPRGSGKIVHNNSGEYFLEIKKYLFGFTIRRRLEKQNSFDAAEDALNELQVDKNFW